jgi:type IV pilus assembly protein PilA
MPDPSSPLRPYPRWPRAGAQRGFSLLELMVVIGIIAILALIALPGIPDTLIRDRIVESLKLTDIVKAPVAATWAKLATMPLDNVGAGLPAADKIVNDYISSVAVESGAIQVTFGNRANVAVQGKVLTLRPAVVADAPVVPVTWVCGNAEAVPQMTAKGLNKTTVPERYLPLSCRAPVHATNP